MSLPLSELPTGRVAKVLNLEVGQEYRRRMAGLGLRPGAAVRIIRRAPLHGPLQVRAGHTDIILRRSDAARILVEPIVQTGRIPAHTVRPEMAPAP
jgi:ferrous iron transport protein A